MQIETIGLGVPRIAATVWGGQIRGRSAAVDGTAVVFHPFGKIGKTLFRAVIQETENMARLSPALFAIVTSRYCTPEIVSCQMAE